MKITIKLKDLTLDQYKKWVDENCLEEKISCFTCPFRKVQCESKFDRLDNCWVKNKEVYDKDFLNQEIEIDIPDLLTKEEKEYLENVFKPFKNRVTKIKLIQSHYYPNFLYIEYTIRSLVDTLNCESHNMSYFKKGTMYKNLEIDKEYTLEKLGLFENQEVKK